MHVLLVARLLMLGVLWQRKTCGCIRLLKENQWTQHFSVSCVVHKSNTIHMCINFPSVLISSHVGCWQSSMSLRQIIRLQRRICTIILANLDSCFCRVCVPEWVFIIAVDLVLFWLSGITLFCDWNGPPTPWKGTCFLLTRSTDLLMVSTLGNFGPGGGRAKSIFGVALTFIHGISPLSTICQAKDTCSVHVSWFKSFSGATSSSIRKGLLYDETTVIIGGLPGRLLVPHPRFYMLQEL